MPGGGKEVRESKVITVGKCVSLLKGKDVARKTIDLFVRGKKDVWKMLQCCLSAVMPGLTFDKS